MGQGQGEGGVKDTLGSQPRDRDDCILRQCWERRRKGQARLVRAGGGPLGLTCRVPRDGWRQSKPPSTSPPCCTELRVPSCPQFLSRAGPIWRHSSLDAAGRAWPAEGSDPPIPEACWGRRTGRPLQALAGQRKRLAAAPGGRSLRVPACLECGPGPPGRNRAGPGQEQAGTLQSNLVTL